MWQASFFPALGQGNDKAPDNPMNGTVEIVVQRGETLWGLAQSYNTTVDELVKLNKVGNPDNIREGKSLWVPSSVAEEKPAEIEDNSVVDNTVNSSWWISALHIRIVQEEPISPCLSDIQRQAAIIPTYEIFVNPPDPPIINTPLDDINVAQKLTVPKTASPGAVNQVPSRSLGRLVSKEDLELLTRVIYGEARGENFEGQVAVGAVVLNRLKDPRFPKTIRDVVYQSGAFTAVEDKQIQLDPNDQSYKAAEAALAGQDPTNGALFYFNPRLATDHWIKSRSVIKRIGNHTFSI